jgi:uridine kinase
MADVAAYKPNVVDLGAAWTAALGQPELCGAWLVWGNSGQGKTSFALQVCRAFAQHTRVCYDSLEQGLSLSLQRAITTTLGGDVNISRFILLNKEPVRELAQRLRRRKSPTVVVVDSLQYSDMSYADYKRLRNEFPKKLFIFISHAEGKEPAGRAARQIRYDADVKIYIEGFRAMCASRFGGEDAYTVWYEGVQKYWGVS